MKKIIRSLVLSALIGGSVSCVMPYLQSVEVFAQNLVVGTISNEYRLYEDLKFSDGLMPAYYLESVGDHPDDKTGKMGFINEKGEFIIPCIYDTARSFSNGIAYVKKDGKSGYINTQGQEVIPLMYDNLWEAENGFIVASNNGKYGVIDRSNNQILPFIYDEITYIGDGFIGAIKDINERGSWGIINLKTGQEVTPYEYAGISTIGFVDEKIIVFKSLDSSDIYNYSQGIVDVNGNEVLPFIYQNISFFNGMVDKSLVQVRKDDKWGVININSGDIVIPIEYEGIYGESAEVFGVRKDGKYAVIDIEGNMILPFEYDYVMITSNSVITASKDDKYGMFDKNGTQLLPFDYKYIFGSYGIYAQDSDVLNPEIFLARTDDKDYIVDNNGKLIFSIDANINLSNYMPEYEMFTTYDRETQKMGYYSKNGVEIMPCIYESVVPFNNGFAFGRKEDYSFDIFRLPTEAEMSSGGAVTMPEVSQNIPVATDNNSIKAKVTSSPIFVNGKEIDLQVYNINDNNYFKLRDVAEVLKGSEKQFDVIWNNDKQSMELTSNKQYTSVGGELVKSNDEPNNVKVTSSSMYVDGVKTDLVAYNIADNNYFKLRDLGGLFNFGVSWDGTNNLVIVDTSQSYSE